LTAAVEDRARVVLAPCRRVQGRMRSELQVGEGAALLLFGFGGRRGATRGHHRGSSKRGSCLYDSAGRDPHGDSFVVLLMPYENHRSPPTAPRSAPGVSDGGDRLTTRDAPWGACRR